MFTTPLRDLQQLLAIFKKWPGVVLIMMLSGLIYWVGVLEDKTTDLKETVEKLTNSVQQYQQMIQDKDKLLAQQEAIRDEHDRKVQQLLNRLGRSQSTTRELEQLMEQRDEALASVESQLEQKDEEIIQQSQQITNLIDRNAKLKSQNDQLSRKVQELEAQGDDFANLKKQHGLLQGQYIDLKHQYDSLQNAAPPRVAVSKIVTYANGFGDPDEALKRTRKAKDIRYARIQFRLDRAIQPNEVVEVELSNNGFKRRNPLVHSNSTEDGAYYVDFVLRKRDIKTGIVYVRYLLGGQLIGSDQVHVR